MRHTENVSRITDSRLVPGPEFVTIEIDYTTGGGIKKTLRLAHGDADQVRVRIVGELESMPKVVRDRSFWASLRRKR
ncbi:hypothetical protein OG548_08090 [Streptomyces sp. NBC_01356]|uniref:hypothetical protein n=1 Tax=Streptomyces sp. NBC_01356 TaxID=2903836 RepID=UPI002E36C5BE|nr:hypothetical protein [Streptomyces sp. NBC_01356]